VTARQWAVEACIAVVVFAAAVWWGTAYWNASFLAGRPPIFYQEYFEPAVMMACGKGFVVSNPQVPAVRAFLYRSTDRFSCSEIPIDANLGTQWVYQGAWRYLMVATAICWRIRGIAWSVLGPLLGVMFGATIAIGYGILRLGMGRLLALFCAFGLSISTLHLLNLPHLRDYSKAPFTLALILIIGVMVKARPARVVLLGCGAAYGLVLGIGYGFRTDFLVNIPVFFIVLFAFVDGGLLKNLPLKLASAALCATVFVITAWPLITVVYRSGGCQWHTALLGLTTTFTDVLEVEDAPYDFGNSYTDGAVFRAATNYARRVNPEVGAIAYCSHEYDVATGQYLLEIARRFPADMLTRVYASVSSIAQLPFRPSWLNAPLPGLAPFVYTKRLSALTSLKGRSTVWITAALLLTSLVSVRLAFFLVFFLLYFGGYPAIQFANRHYFHLEIIAWWAFGFVVHQLASAAFARLRGIDGHSVRPDWRQAAWVVPTILAVVVVPLLAFRAYQQATLPGFFQKYLNASLDSWPLEPAQPGFTHLAPSLSLSHQQTAETLVVVALNAWKCADRPSVTFRYDKAFPNDDLSRTFTLERPSTVPQPTYIFSPVYQHFLGIEFSDVRPGCLDGVSSVRDVSRMTLLLPAVLPPGWERERLFEQLKAWPW
jgi:hypothetical protein